MSQAVATLHLEQHSDRTGAKIGMWLFLFTEVLLFAGMFLLYAVYRLRYPQEFSLGAAILNPLMGTVNTIILLTSSLSVALSIAALERGNKRFSIQLLIFTILCALAFLVIKYFEWGAKISHGIYPGSEHMESFQEGVQIFFNLYYVMTGLHGLHVIIGAIVLGITTWFIIKNPYEQVTFHPHQLRSLQEGQLCIIGPGGEKIWEGIPVDGKSLKHLDISLSYHDSAIDKYNEVDLVILENGGLYWHLVDVIWIFLFPLFYLIT